MLKTLRIKNFAIIEKIELTFDSGLTVFTGETGAGKSILIEALGFLLGERGRTDWVRSGAKGLEVEAVFERGSESFNLRRTLDAGGRSKAFLQGKPLKLSALAQTAEGLVDFHGQHEHQTLLRPGVQLDYLDAFGGHDRAGAAAAYAAWKELLERREALHISEDERLQKIDLYKFQVAEIDGVSPSPGEEAKLAADLPRLKNSARLGDLATGAYDALYGGEEGAAQVMTRAESALEDMARLDDRLEEARSRIERARLSVEEVAGELARYREVDADPAALDDLITRQDKIARLKKKYGATVEEVLAYRETAQSRLQALVNHDAEAAEIDKRAARAEKALGEICEALHSARRKTAVKLAKRVQAQLKDLGMAQAALSVSVEMADGEYAAHGADRVEFLIAPNPGEAAKPLRQIASGGELSRVMLALKTVLAAQDKVGLMVFDEVDTGVGAPVGRAVGHKLAELGGHRQVFCVTHLPQVACYARTHFHVAKKVAGGRTATRVDALVGDRRIEAVAAMLGGRKLTSASLRHAKELIESV
jgi:DNA repair protein RecN (Recombination protein N)